MEGAVPAGREEALKVVSFTVRATLPQSIRWKRAADGEGFASVGSWAGGALDAFLEHRARAGQPIPLAWHFGAFKVRLLDGHEVTVPGKLSPPFAYFRGTAEGPVAGHRFSLVHLSTGKVIATLKAAGQARSLASELAPIYARDDNGGAAVVERHVREQA
jgi:hypothetical protein